MERNLLQQRTEQSKRTFSREVLDRLSTLNRGELALLADASGQEGAHLMWVAACRRYELIGEFAREVIREKYLIMTPELGFDDFDDFVRSKSLWHDELNELKATTLRKLRQNVFRMLRDSELLSEGGRIVPILLSTRLAESFARDGGGSLKFFPITDIEIERVAR